MSNPDQDAGIIQTLLERFTTQRLPMMLAMKEKVDQGETLSEYDISKLDEFFADTQNIQPLIERHPECHDLASRIQHLYKEILDKAMENEKKA